LLSDDLRPRLAALRSGISTDDAETGETSVHRIKRGKKAERARESSKLKPSELSLWDLVSYLWVREWTPGSDGLGHPHLHVWIFAPYIEQRLIQRLWARALADCLERDTQALGDQTVVLAADGSVFVPVVDVRVVHSNAEHEIVKYLTKEWEIDDQGVRRARPEVFALVYAETDGQRQRQGSAGFASWAVKKISICPCCGHEAAYGQHWARVQLEFFGKVEAEHAVSPPSTGPPSRPGLAKTDTSDRESEWRRAYWEKRDAEWADSIELRILRGTFAKAVLS
jgi:hypothetical protein